jgi:hypothetical protein
MTPKNNTQAANHGLVPITVVFKADPKHKVSTFFLTSPMSAESAICSRGCQYEVCTLTVASTKRDAQFVH